MIKRKCFEGNAGILCATCAKHYVRSGGACTWCKDGVDTAGMLWMVIVAAIVYVGMLSYVLSRTKEAVQPPKTTASASRIGTSLMVLSAIAKMRRKSRASTDIQDTLEGEAEGQVEGQVSESTGDNAGEFEVDAFSKFAGRLRIFFGFMQINAAMNLAVDVPWPQAFLLETGCKRQMVALRLCRQKLRQ